MYYKAPWLRKYLKCVAPVAGVALSLRMLTPRTCVLAHVCLRQVLRDPFAAFVHSLEVAAAAAPPDPADMAQAGAVIASASRILPSCEFGAGITCCHHRMRRSRYHEPF